MGPRSVGWFTDRSAIECILRCEIRAKLLTTVEVEVVFGPWWATNPEDWTIGGGAKRPPPMGTA